MLRTVHLGGYLGKKFKPEYKLDVQSAAEAMRAINSLTGNRFCREIQADKYYRVVRGKDLNNESKALNVETLTMKFDDEDIFITPVPAGSGDDGWFQIILGVVIIAASIYFAPAGMGFAAFMESGYGAAAMFGASLMIGGIATVMTPALSTGYADREEPDERPSYLFNGPTNTIEQGGPIPVVHGKFQIGSTVISSALVVEDV